MDDILVKGAWAGLIGTLGDALIHKLCFFLFRTATTAQYIAGLVFHKTKFTDLEYFIGFLIHLSAGAFAGTLLALILKYSSEKYAYLKGVVFGLLMWIVHIAIIPNVINSPQPFILRTAAETVVDLFAHLIFGILATKILLKPFGELKM